MELLTKLLNELQGLHLTSQALPQGVIAKPGRFAAGNCNCNCDCDCQCKCGDYCDCKCDCVCQCKCDCDEKGGSLYKGPGVWDPIKKLNVVRLVLQGQDVENVARRFEVPIESLTQWKEAYEKHGPTALREIG